MQGRPQSVTICIVIALTGAFVASARAITWRQCQDQPADWYESAEAIRIADNVLFYQAVIGGWYKNDGSLHPSGNAATEKLSDRQRQDHLKSLRERKFPCTLDNDATHTEMRYLAKVHSATGQPKFREGFLKGVRYLLQAQYASGGWAQFYPLRPGYSSRITFNDGAMIGAMEVLHDVVNRRAPYDLADELLRQECGQALAKGLECILKCQIVVKGRRTAWCQQHDEHNFAPTQGRISELPSISGAESVGIVKYLMSIERPSPEVVAAIEGAVRWFEEARITGVRVVTVEDADVPGGKDRRVIKDAKATPVWARYYEIGSNRPMFIEQGVVKYSLAELSLKHRLGHGWIGGRWPARLLEVEYPAWLSSRSEN